MKREGRIAMLWRSIRGCVMGLSNKISTHRDVRPSSAVATHVGDVDRKRKHFDVEKSVRCCETTTTPNGDSPRRCWLTTPFLVTLTVRRWCKLELRVQVSSVQAAEKGTKLQTWGCVGVISFKVRWLVCGVEQINLYGSTDYTPCIRPVYESPVLFSQNLSSAIYIRMHFVTFGGSKLSCVVKGRSYELFVCRESAWLRVKEIG